LLRRTQAESIQAVKDKYTAVANEKAYDATLIRSLKSALVEKKKACKDLKKERGDRYRLELLAVITNKSLF
jgi:hypothetical protein